MKNAHGILILVILSLLLGFPAAAGPAGPKIYWHFTFEAFVDVPSTTAVEWVWVTVCEYDKAKANPMADETIREYGGTLEGTVFAFIRGAAWRSAHHYEVDDICRGRKDKRYISWDASESDSVFCAGQFFDPRPIRDGTGRVTLGPPMFRLVFTTRRILHEDGAWEDLKNQARVYVGPIRTEGSPGERIKGGFHLQEVNYLDGLKHYRSCNDAWVEQYLTAFRHFNHDALEDEIPDVGQSVLGQVPFGFKDKNNIVWEVHRSRSPEHPHWKQRTM